MRFPHRTGISDGAALSDTDSHRRSTASSANTSQAMWHSAIYWRRQCGQYHLALRDRIEGDVRTAKAHAINQVVEYYVTRGDGRHRCSVYDDSCLRPKCVEARAAQRRWEHKHQVSMERIRGYLVEREQRAAALAARDATRTEL